MCLTLWGEFSALTCLFVWKGSLFKIRLHHKIARIYAHAGAELTRNLPHRDVGGADVVLNPCMGGHRIVTCNGAADLTTKGVQNGAARGISMSATIL